MMSTYDSGGCVGQAYPGRSDDGSAGVIEAYQARLRDRYGHLDIDSLLPLHNQQEQIAVGVREVFVPQTVRTDPPPVDLPRELWQRLADSGVLDDRDLPGDLDHHTLAKLRHSYEARPARPVLEVLAEPDGQKMVLLGDPGAGKSTLARYLAVVLAQRGGDVLPAGLVGLLPVLIELRRYADPTWRGLSFVDFLDRQHHTDDRLGLPRTLLERRLHEPGRVLVIFDGLDELFDRGDREVIAHQITGFATHYPGARVVVTSRHVGYQRGPFDAAGFSHHMLQDLGQKQIDLFTQRWYRIACPGNPPEAARLRERLLTAIASSRSVQELAGNPLLLTILAVIGRRQTLPRDRHNVYRHAVTVLVEHWEVSKHLAATDPALPELDREDKLDLLRLIARRMQDGRAGLAGNHIVGTDLFRMFETYFQVDHALPPGPAKVAARAMLEQFQHRNFILSRFGSQVYGFVHRTFLEYLAAEDIDVRFGNRELSESDLLQGVFGARWSDPAWHEVLLLLTGIREHFAGRIIDRLLAADPYWRLRDKLPQHILLAMRCLGELRKPVALGPRHRAIAGALTHLLESLRSRPYDLALLTAFKQIVVPVITTLGPRWPGRDYYLAWYRLRGQIHLSDLRMDSRQMASIANQIALALDPSSDLRQYLFTVATDHHHEAIRRTAVEAIASGWPGDPETLLWLRERITDDADEYVRQAAVRAVASGWPEDPGTLPLLRARATGDTDAYARTAAVRAIASGWPEDAGTLPLLRECATTDEHEYVRQAALRAIASGWPEDAGTLPLLHDYATGDANAYVRRAATQAIVSGRADDPGTLFLLRERATSDHHAYVRDAAIRALASGWRVHPGTLPLLHECATTDNHEDVRMAAVDALASGWPEDPGTLRLLRERSIDDGNEYVRGTAVRLLASGWSEDPGTLPLLRERASSDTHEYVRQAAMHAVAVGWAKDPGTLFLLRERATDDANEYVRRAAVRAIASGWSEDPGTLPLLRECATGNVNEDIRIAALTAIASRWPEDPGTLPLLRERATSDDQPIVRDAAVYAIAVGWAEHPGTLPLLHECATSDNDEDVRTAAVNAIVSGWPGDPGTLSLMRQRDAVDRRKGAQEAHSRRSR
ncbi:hypothetical protein Aab01nite_11690 [Paractinoplanes abujensis]|nr:hypothetical protein Aab01nite_11690 [Actinoplanes abujensis]